LLSLFYRSWEKHQSAIAFETACASGTEDAITSALWAVIGTKPFGSRQQYQFDDSTLLYYAGHLSNRRPTAESIRVTVQELFDVPVAIQQFVGQWIELPSAEQSRIGCEPLGRSLGNQLGVDTVIGKRVWDNENRFRLTIGPLTWDRFQEFLPAQPLLRVLTDFVRRIVGPQYDFDIRVLVESEQVQGVRLDTVPGVRLGWNTWLGHRKLHDAGDVTFEFFDGLAG
jgi:type VI secretion system protein ImpH